MFHSEQTPLLPRLGEVSAFDEALTSGKVYVLLFGLSIHSFFEGLGNCFIFRRWSSTSGFMSGSAFVFTFFVLRVVQARSILFLKSLSDQIQIQSRSMSDPSLSDIDLKMNWLVLDLWRNLRTRVTRTSAESLMCHESCLFLSNFVRQASVRRS